MPLSAVRNLGKGTHGQGIIDQGTDDEFLTEHLKPEIFDVACQKMGQNLTLRMQEGYDHSYYFIASFIEDHIKWHAEALSKE